MFKKKMYRFLRKLAEDAGLSLAFLGFGALALRTPGDGSDIAVAVASLVIGILLRLGALVMDLLEPLALGEAAANPESGEDKSE